MTPQTEVHPQSKKALTLLTIVNYFNYIDRFILSAVLLSIKIELQLTDFEAGLLATAFMVPYMFTSPLFGWLGDTQSRTKLLAGGVLLWSLASLMTGWAGTFIILAFSRFILGFGESAFTTVATPFISDFYPSSKRGRALAIFSSGLPVGAALGFVLGGILAKWIGWRNAFLVVGFPGILMSILILTLPDPKTKHIYQKFDIKKIIKDLFQNSTYFWATLGYCAYSFVVGGIAHWVPTYLQRTYSLDQMKANMIFGGIAVGSGLIGTLLGGQLGDRWSNTLGSGGHLKIAALSMGLSFPFYVATLYAPNVEWLVFFLAITQLLFFLSTSPISVSLIESVPNPSRTTAMAIAIFLCHILGDALSSPLIGLISDRTNSLKTGMLICAPVILICSFFWFKGLNCIKSKVEIN